MPSARQCAALVLGLLLVVSLPACRTMDKPEKAGMTGAGPSPIDQRSLDRQAAWAEAIRGLGFDTGYVLVERPPASSNRELAREHMARGDAEREVNHKVPAVAAYADAVKAAPDWPDAYLALGRAMIVKGEIELAIACFRTVVQMAPERIDARVDLANALAMVDRREDAIAEMEAVLALDPNLGVAHERLAVWYYYGGEYGAAWEHVRAARDVDHPVPPQFVNLLASRMPEPTG